MSVKSFCSVMSNTTCHIPEKLRKIFEECENLSDVLDTLLKVGCCLQTHFTVVNLKTIINP